MEAHERSVAATLAYYGAFRWPLTLVEISQRLISAGRLGEPGGVRPDVGMVTSAVDALTAAGTLRASDGLWTVGDTPEDMLSHRVTRQKESADKWMRMLASASWLQAVPFVRMMAASGSLAMGSSAPKSDWDVLVIVREGRLYTARLGLLVTAWLMRRLRTKRMRVAPDRFCFNHIITTDGLAIRHRSLFTAQSLSWLVPFYDPYGYAIRLRQANQWTGQFVATPMGEEFRRRTVPLSRTLRLARRVSEAVLTTFVGSVLERAVRAWMRRRIEREPATHERGGRIVADDRELEFHPHSFEAVALARYNATLTRLGLGQFAERDSGLRA